MEKSRVLSLGQYFIFNIDEDPKYKSELCDLQITTEDTGAFNEKGDFYVKEYNCKIKLGERRYVQTRVNPDDCRIRFYNGNKDEPVYLWEEAELSEGKSGYCFDAVKFLKKHDIDFKLCEKDTYTSCRANSDGREVCICPSGKFYATRHLSSWEGPSEYSLEAVFFKKNLILDGDAIRKVWIPEFNYTDELKYICADHTKTEEFILSLYDNPMEMTKEAFKQQLLDNDTLGIIVVYTWDGKRIDLINLEKEAYEKANRMWEERQKKLAKETNEEA